jgi:hypothetical protein
MMKTVIMTLLLAVYGLSGAVAQSFTGTFELGGRRIPLPPGEWQKVAEEAALRSQGRPGGPPAADVNLVAFLLRTAQGRVTGMILVGTSREPSAGFNGFGTHPDCARGDVLARQVEANTPVRQDCWVLDHAVMRLGRTPTEFQRRMFDAARAAGGMPPTMLRVMSRQSNQLHYLTVMYYFVPDPQRFPPSTEPWATNPWHRDRLDENRAAYVRTIMAWAPSAHAAVGRALNGRETAPLSEP